MTDKKLTWQKEYPTIADVKLADASTVYAWSEHLPEPDNDVQRTVLKRIRHRAWDESQAQMKQLDPEIAKKMAELEEVASAILGTNAKEL